MPGSLLKSSDARERNNNRLPYFTDCAAVGRGWESDLKEYNSQKASKIDTNRDLMCYWYLRISQYKF